MVPGGRGQPRLSGLSQTDVSYVPNQVYKRCFKSFLESDAKWDEACTEESLENMEGEEKLKCEDFLYHQSMRVKKIIVHKKYRGQDNDIAMIQLYPTDPESGECIVMGDTVQHACINSVPTGSSNGFKTGKYYSLG